MLKNNIIAAIQAVIEETRDDATKVKKHFNEHGNFIIPDGTANQINLDDQTTVTYVTEIGIGLNDSEGDEFEIDFEDVTEEDLIEILRKIKFIIS